MRCKNCKTKFEPKTFLQKYCTNEECIRVFVEEAKSKAWKKTKKNMQENLETIQDLVKDTQIVFNKYIRLRDKDELCISCKQKPKKSNAGHFYNANNHWNVRFNENNVHLQCEHCNTFLSGNLINYRLNLINKIGLEQLTLLEAEAKKTRKFTKEELKETINIYKKKIKQYEAQ